MSTVDVLPFERVCEVYVPGCEGEKGVHGSGVQVADDFVLTAGHVVVKARDSKVRCQVRLAPPESPVYPAEPVWTADRQDVALLRIIRPAGESPAVLPPLRWGRLVTTRSSIPAAAMGFPDANMVEGDDGAYWDSLHARGTISAGDHVKSGEISFQVESAPRSDDARSWWEGMSGAGLFVNGVLVGVVVKDPPQYESRRLTAVAVHAFAGDRDFANRIWGPDGPALEAAEFAAVQHRHRVLGQESVGRWLTADAAVVPFTGRKRELATLRRWCDDPAPTSARVLVGPGGRGKTRLARQFCQYMSQAGWTVVDIADGAPPPDSLGAVQGRLLVLVDQAERRRDEIAALVDGLPKQGPVRLLLTSRTDRAWLTDFAGQHLAFAALTGAYGDHRPAGLVMAVPPMDTDPDERVAAYKAAYRAFGQRLSSRSGTARVPEAYPADLASMLGSDRYDDILSIHMEALARVLLAAGGTVPAGPVDAERVLLTHEESYWRAAAKQWIPLYHSTTAGTLKRLVAVATTCTLLDEEPAAQNEWLRRTRQHPEDVPPDGAEHPCHILDNAPGLPSEKPCAPNAPTPVHEEAAAWLTSLYGGKTLAWSGMRPDTLQEAHVGRMLTGKYPGLFDDVVPWLTDRQLGYLFSTLARSAQRYPDVVPIIKELIKKHPRRLGWAAFVVAANGPATLSAAMYDLDVAAWLFRDARQRQDLVDAVGPVGWLLDRLTGRRRRGTHARRESARPNTEHSAATDTVAGAGAGGGVGAAAAVAVPPTGLVSATKQLVSTVAGQLARLPGVRQAVELTRHPELATPDLIRSAEIVVAVLATGGLAAVLLLPGDPDRPEAAAPQASPTAGATVRSGPSSSPAATAPATTGPGRPGPPSTSGVDAVPQATGTGALPEHGGQGVPTPTPTPVPDPRPSDDGLFPITVNATALSAPKITIGSAAVGLETSREQVVQLKPGTYRLATGAIWTDASFTVGPTGTVEIPPGTGALAGDGTRTLQIRGFAVHVDATGLSAPTFAVEWIGANYSVGRVQEFRLLPAAYRLASGNVWTDARLTVTRAGTVDYPVGAEYLSGRGGTTLVARGVGISVDARRLSSARFSIAWVGSNYDARQVKQLRLLPATYRLGDGVRWSSAQFIATAGGTVDYEQAATYLSGRGTPTLTILTNTLP